MRTTEQIRQALQNSIPNRAVYLNILPGNDFGYQCYVETTGERPRYCVRLNYPDPEIEKVERLNDDDFAAWIAEQGRCIADILESVRRPDLGAVVGVA